jgi:hypothetical protein
MMNTLLTILLLLIFTPDRFTEEPERMWHVKNESRLAISGESNVNDFKCEVDRYFRADNLSLYSTGGTDYVFSHNYLVLDLMEFDCGKRLITRDFRETLNAENEPGVIISFISLDRLPDVDSGNDVLTGILRVTIAGISKETEVQLSMGKQDNGLIYLHGMHDFEFTDFGLEAPTKFMGLINVKNELKVTFDLILEELPYDRFTGVIE